MKRRSLVSLLTVGLLAVAASPALAARSATPIAAGTTAGCAAPALTSALAAYGDWRSYFLAPGGDFETSARGWTLTGGATTSTGSGPLRLGAAANSLRLPAGATATSPIFCVDVSYPTFRFFSTKGNAPLSVDVIYPALGTKKAKATTIKGGATSWTLAKDVDLRPTLVTKDTGWRLVQLRYIAATGATGDWLVDDVLVDPRMR
jgi:hypothetical protein